jgi:hypothetical protein
MRLGLLVAVGLLTATAAKAETPNEVCKPLLAQGREPYVQCMRDVERLPFLQRYPDLAGAYDQFYSEWDSIAATADLENWDAARYAAEAAKPKIKLVIAKQASDARRQDAAAQQATVDLQAEEKRARAARNRHALAAALTAFGNAGRQPPAVTTGCVTYPNGVTNCTTR